MALHDLISPAHEAAMKSDFLSGMSTRAVAKKYGVCEKSAALRRKSLKDAGAIFPNCKCGRSVNHKGMCSDRVKAFAMRPAPEPVNYPRIQKTAWRLSGFHEVSEPSPEDLIIAIDAALPRRYSWLVRQEARQEILLALLESRLRLGEVADRAHEFIRDVFRQY